MHSGGLGVHAYDDTTGVLGGRSGPTNGAYAVADIRVDGHPKSVQLGVRGMEQPAPEIGRAHVCTPVINAHLVCRRLLEKKKREKKLRHTFILHLEYNNTNMTYRRYFKSGNHH